MRIKSFKLNREERRVEESLLRGEFNPVSPEENAAFAAAFARLRRDAVLSLRINSRDLADIKAKARKLGVPYQRLITELLHRYAVAG